MKKVSIVVPAYNCEKVIEKSIKSLMAQTYENIEIILINDGSEDNTEAVCENLAETDNRIKTVTIENLGVSNARNTALKMATGEYIAFMDSDDFVSEKFIENMVAKFSDDVDLVCCGYNVVKPNGKYLFSQCPAEITADKEHYYKAVEMLQEYKSFNVLWNKMFRNSIIQENNIKMDVSISMGEDLLFVIDYLFHCNKEFVSMSITDYNYVLSSGGLQSKFKDGLNLRISQNHYLEELYNKNGYEKNGLYLEYLRCFYTSVLESKGNRSVTQKILTTPEFSVIRKQKINCSKKFKAFLMILKTKNKTVIGLSVKIFSLMMTVRGKSYKW